jgi:hypothetical protein
MSEDNATRRQADSVRRLGDVAALYREGMQLNCVHVASYSYYITKRDAILLFFVKNLLFYRVQ